MNQLISRDTNNKSSAAIFLVAKGTAMSILAIQPETSIHVNTNFEIPNFLLWGERAVNFAEGAPLEALTDEEIITLARAFESMLTAGDEGLRKLFTVADNRHLESEALESAKDIAAHIWATSAREIAE